MTPLLLALPNRRIRLQGPLGALLLTLCLLTLVPAAVQAQSSAEVPVMYYAIQPRVTAFTAPDSGQAYFTLRRREPVEVLEDHGRWVRVRTQERATGYVPKAQLSNVWIRISKREATLYLYEGDQLLRAFPADFGQNAFADKEKRGSLYEPDHWRTPDGVFFIANKNPRSQFYKALVLNYPNAEDAERGLAQGYISKAEYDAILAAEAAIDMPPMNTALGGWIEVHGDGTGARSNWTQGCVAVRNDHIDYLWRHVYVGTPVLIEP